MLGDFNALVCAGTIARLALKHGGTVIRKGVARYAQQHDAEGEQDVLYGQITRQYPVQSHGDGRDFHSLKDGFQYSKENGADKFVPVFFSAERKEPSEYLNHSCAPPSTVSRTEI